MHPFTCPSCLSCQQDISMYKNYSIETWSSYRDNEWISEKLKYRKNSKKKSVQWPWFRLGHHLYELLNDLGAQFDFKAQFLVLVFL